MKLTGTVATVAVLVIGAATVWAESASPATPSPSPTISNPRVIVPTRRAGASSAANKAETQTPASLHQRMLDMQGTLSGMHLVMKEMRARAAKSGAKDPAAKANLEMWELMLGHLDKQFDELRMAAAARDDVEARRAAMYKQAEAKAAAAAKAAQSQSASQPSTAGAAAPGAGQNTAAAPTAGAPTAGASSATPSTTPSSSPN